ncbi:hypothetical protein, partial [Enterococcus faecium]|uniref:hypothetical protein n=1 Tax=Enterococcus faecium TaxID=1352 RepID=UPI003AACD52E
QLSQGNGISLSGSNPILIRAKRAALLIFMDSGFTPSGIGADANVQVVPYSPTDGSVITYNLRHMFFRVEATTGGESRIYPEVYTGTGQFSGATNLFGGANYLNISGAGVYQHTTTTFTTTTV